MFVDTLVTHTTTSGVAGVVEVQAATASTYSVVSGNIFTNTTSLATTGGCVFYSTPQAHYATVTGNLCLQQNGALVASDAAGATLSITGNTLAGSTFPVVVSLSTLGLAARFFESGNTIAHGGNYIVASGALTGFLVSGSRDRAWTYADGASFTPLNCFKHHAVNATANCTAGAPSGTSWDGQEIWIRIRNTTGGAVTMTWNAVYLGPAAMSANITAGQTRAILFVRKETGTTPCWRYVTHTDST
jgi:hypothetical protein